MDLIAEIKNDIQKAVKAGDKSLTQTLKYLYSILQTEQAREGEFDAVKVLQKEMKAKNEALKMFKKAGREDLVESEKKEIKVLEKYLPQMMTREEIERLVKEVIANSDDQSPGKIIGEVMSKVKGRAEGSKVAEIVNENIN